MQKIFKNAKIYTLTDNKTSESFLINDDSIVYVGNENEVLELKTEDTKVVDLKNKVVIPTFYCLGINIYLLIEQKLKNAKHHQFIEKTDIFDENYDKFINFNVYRKEFLKLQDEFLSQGITTILEVGVSWIEFIFWKKISESGDLKLDIIGYVDILKYKQVMDDNCRSYRKYKNHFRLGGYYLKIDGDILNRQAFVSRPLKGNNLISGYSNVYEEHLNILIKNALEEKKQLVVETNGDAALDMFLKCFKDNIKDKKIEDLFRPIVISCNMIENRQLKILKELDIAVSFKIDNYYNCFKELNELLGFFKLKKAIPLKKLQQNNIKVMFNYEDNVPNIFKNLLFLSSGLDKNKRNILKHNKIELYTAFNLIIANSAYLCFDSEFKGTIECGKRADFLVLNKSPFNDNLESIVVENVYKDGEEIYNKK